MKGGCRQPMAWGFVILSSAAIQGKLLVKCPSGGIVEELPRCAAIGQSPVADASSLQPKRNGINRRNRACIVLVEKPYVFSAFAQRERGVSFRRCRRKPIAINHPKRTWQQGHFVGDFVLGGRTQSIRDEPPPSIQRYHFIRRIVDFYPIGVSAVPACQNLVYFEIFIR